MGTTGIVDREYHPGLSEGDRLEKDAYGEYRAGGVVSERYDMEAEVETVIGNLKKNKACGNSVSNKCIKHGWEEWKERLLNFNRKFPKVWKRSRL